MPSALEKDTAGTAFGSRSGLRNLRLSVPRKAPVNDSFAIELPTQEH